MKSSTLVNHAYRAALTKEIYARKGGDSGARSANRWREAVWDAECTCAAEFGAACGWAVTKKKFGLKTLGAGGVHLHNDYAVKHPVFDHVTYYRGGGPRNRRATAIVSQPYAVCFSAYDKVAERYGLNWQILENEGWYAVDAV